jgi:hypothetical protein
MSRLYYYQEQQQTPLSKPNTCHYWFNLRSPKVWTACVAGRLTRVQQQLDLERQLQLTPTWLPCSHAFVRATIDRKIISP